MMTVASENLLSDFARTFAGIGRARKVEPKPDTEPEAKTNS